MSKTDSPKMSLPLRGFLFIFLLGLLSVPGLADLRLTVPKRTKPTPVQQYNRDGVKALEKHNYGTAKKLFYKAYLLDPNDPFTLNNLGYVAELEGDLERAQRFYELSQEQNSDAVVDTAGSTGVVGKTVSQVAGHADANNLQVNRMNVQAVGLLSKDRGPEADVVLTKALAVDPKNPFTLNNLGYAKEKEGELESALDYYRQSANQNSKEPIVVTLTKDWRGQPISAVAAENAKKVSKLLQKETREDRSVQVARLNLRGVSALNRNDKEDARRDFQQAYKLDPADAFTLNNMGYLAEMEGDRETAQFFYDKAQQARHADHRVTLATRKDIEGEKVARAAEGSQAKVEEKMAADLEKRRGQGPPQLKRRGNPPVNQPATQPATQPPVPETQEQKPEIQPQQK
jgi:Flp pilus assembly protein TadD